MKRKYIFIFIFVIVIALIFDSIFHFFSTKVDFKVKTKIEDNVINQNVVLCNNFVKTNANSYLYDVNDRIVGMIGKNVELVLDDGSSLIKGKYFSVLGLGATYYIKYDNLANIDKLSIFDERYKEYIVFNENIVTNNKTSFYDENENLVYQFNKSFDLPIIVKDDNRYGIEYNNRLLFVKKEDVVNIKNNHNTDISNSSGVGVLNYHAFYDEEDSAEKANCSTIICHSKTQFKTHLDYFKENKILTLKMNEVEMYIDGKIQLPKSVLITIDDGDRTKIAVDMLTEYEMYATIFLITAWYDPDDYYKTDYIELHSHGDNLHKPGVCSTGQGGGIQCLSEEKIQDDLQKSRKKLNNTTYFCYPFYEYNEYSIKMLKKAGFTMAFAGENDYGDNLVHVGSDKFRLRRFVIVTYTTLEDFNKYFGQIY